MAISDPMRQLPVIVAFCWLGLARAHAETVDIPESHRADLTSAPERPPSEPAQAQARALFEAIVRDDPALAASFFFPREAFVLVKAMAKPERYYDRLRARFDQDIHALHARTKDLAEARFERLELTRRGGWVAKGEEGNKLPYWAARHAFLHYRVGKEARKLEVRVLISWDNRWYVIHLSEFQ